VAQNFAEADGILIPGGFGQRGIEGKILAAQYARENNIPFFGICLGMQCAFIEFGRNVCDFAGANSTEFDPDTPHPMIDLLETQRSVKDMGGTMRLGGYPCHLKAGTRARSAYSTDDIVERHRHRYEVNNKYLEKAEQAGLVISGLYPDGGLVEIIELPDHPWYMGVQFHPEFQSKPVHTHPLFRDFIAAALERQRSRIAQGQQQKSKKQAQ
jgi:CTP synthase